MAGILSAWSSLLHTLTGDNMPSGTQARCAAALSTRPQSIDALKEATATALERLGGQADLALLFISPHHAESAERIAADACKLVGTTTLLGCTGESIVATGEEIEEEPALSLWLARL